MGTALPVKELSDWIRRAFRPRSAGDHCVSVRERVRLSGGDVVDLLSVRHRLAPGGKGPESFVAELWELLPGPAGDGHVSGMFRKLGIFRAWYAQILEAAEVRGLRRRHRFSLHGNVVAPVVEPGPLTDLVAQHGGEVALWTYGAGQNPIEFLPHTAGTEEEEEPANELALCLDHLAWEETGRGLEDTAPADAV